MSDTPRTHAIMAMVRKLDREALSHEYRIAMREGVECGIEQLERELAEARRAEEREAADSRELAGLLAEVRMDASAYRNVLWDNGFVMCDIPACNCGSWHYRYGLPERMDEIREALRDADVLDNSTGNLPLNAIRKLVAQRDEARMDAERYRWLRAKYEGADFRYGEDERSVLTFTWPHAVMASLDAAIDAAMKVE